MKKWNVIQGAADGEVDLSIEEIREILLKNRGLEKKEERARFLSPTDPHDLTPEEVGIDPQELRKALDRILKAIEKNESIVVYADYDADGITAGAAMWETLWYLGARAMPYIPHRVDEGYGLSEKGIDAVIDQYDPSLIITVDHGITAFEKVAYAKSKGIDVIVTDHHVKPEIIPECIVVHTTELAGSGVSWFVANQLLRVAEGNERKGKRPESLELATIGTIADLVPLIGPNRSIAKYGLANIRTSVRVGLIALLADAGVEQKNVDTYTISHMLAPRLNAMGRIEHALDALRLLCTKEMLKARLLAQKLGITNKERQTMTEESVTHARALWSKSMESHKTSKKLIFLYHESYNQGIIGLVAGKLVEQHYLPAIVLSKGQEFSKASARSIAGFNIIEAIRSASDLLVDAGGHPMAAGFTVETKNLEKLQLALETIAQKQITEDILQRVLTIDMEIPLDAVTERLWSELQQFQPFGIGNFEPVFATRGLVVQEAKPVGKDAKHLKLRISSPKKPHLSKPLTFDCIAFGLGSLYKELKQGTTVDIAYNIDMNVWNGNRNLQLKIKDIQIQNP